MGFNSVEEYEETLAWLNNRERASLQSVRRCDFCQRPYDEWRPRTPAERETLNRTIFATGPAATIDRACCPGCFEQVIGSAPRLNNNSSLDVGASNSGAPNMLLQRFGAKVTEE